MRGFSYNDAGLIIIVSSSEHKQHPNTCKCFRFYIWKSGLHVVCNILNFCLLSVISCIWLWIIKVGCIVNLKFWHSYAFTIVQRNSGTKYLRNLKILLSFEVCMSFSFYSWWIWNFYCILLPEFLLLQLTSFYLCFLVCQRKLILKHTHKYMLGLWRPRAAPAKA